MRIRVASTLLTLLLCTVAWADEMRSVVDAAGRTVSIPVQAKRVVSQNDNRLTLPLLELGTPLVGSAGRLDAQGQPYMRAVPDLLGITYANSGIEFVGTYSDLDYERIAALKPDLIVTMIEAQAEPLSRIAPTVVIDPNEYPMKDGMQRLAEISGQQANYQRLADNYARKLAQARGYFDALETKPQISVTFSFPAGDALYVYRDLGALTVALDDLGLALPDWIAQMDERQIALSPERLIDLDADFLINFYGSTPEDGPAPVRAGLNNFFPGWCQALFACREGQVLFFPYASFGYAFSALELNLDLLTTHIVGREWEARP
ncbi:ABC transporter substrate-binding protein [Saccharospirillum mangrovi]|uniref:ABC transporter substrate-binding protein n=1 Tax=Saccharospirillum mangrovi TaxID=2161747 RepID=UPI000D36799B|nr:ABC transporter substrate-binding protein [Saccharospirillum mangrovi]